MTNFKSDQFCILPSGNREEFPRLDQELVRRGIKAQYKDLDTGGRIYCIPHTEISKLPHDEKGVYLGDDNSGHSIYIGTKALYNTYSWAGTAWTNVIKEDPENAA